MITKKDISLNMLKAIESIAQPNLDIIQLKKEENTFYSFIETDINSQNYFKIFIDSRGKIGNYDPKNYGFEWRPENADRSITRTHQGNLQDVASKFEEWIKLIREIYETPSVHDDFVKQYADFYFNEFKITDKDAYTSPFNPAQQDLVELYLASLTKAIEESKEIDNNIKSELISEIREINQALPTSTKAKVMKGVTRVFGKLFKISKSFAKEIIAEAKKHLVKKLIEFGVEYASKALEAFTNSQ
ncbi:MAG TPA: hypothetical protein VGQ59_00835 [Cyclobacteriaceae bacterium]|jgi:uridine kinase|nr:hypothetical protein [Cyclobacteriaceae bacterium]